jgi:hypothetical protein
MRTVRAARYVLPLKEGGSVPALVEGDDLGLYIVKLRGAAQGKKALVAEVVAGELARAAALAVPEIVLVDVDGALAASEPDPEIAEPLEKSAGLNAGLDYLPGSITFDPLAGPAPDADTASRIVLFDALVMNVDRTARNTNLLTWHKRLWLIDHGAALYFHHGWPVADPLESSNDPFAEVRDHVLLRRATALEAAARALAAAIGPEVIERVVGDVPDDWIAGDGGGDAAAQRDLYRSWLQARMTHLPAILDSCQASFRSLEEGKRARA